MSVGSGYTLDNTADNFSLSIWFAVGDTNIYRRALLVHLPGWDLGTV